MNASDAARIVLPALRRPHVARVLDILSCLRETDPKSLFMHMVLQNVPRTVIAGNSGPYLTRYDLGDGPDGSHAYVHEFFRPDEDNWLHSHPWGFVAYPINGYTEQRWNGTRRELIERRPGEWYAMAAGSDYHRIDSLRLEYTGSSWSMVFTTPKAPKPDPNQDAWDFWMPETGERIPWRKFIEAKGRMMLEVSNARK